MGNKKALSNILVRENTGVNYKNVSDSEVDEEPKKKKPSRSFRVLTQSIDLYEYDDVPKTQLARELYNRIWFSKYYSSLSKSEKANVSYVSTMNYILYFYDPKPIQMIYPEVYVGRYLGGTPGQAAKKAFTQICRKLALKPDKFCGLTFDIIETTKGRSSYSKPISYNGCREREEKILKRDDKEYSIQFKNKVKAYRPKSDYQLYLLNTNFANISI